MKWLEVKDCIWGTYCQCYHALKGWTKPERRQDTVSGYEGCYALALSLSHVLISDLIFSLCVLPAHFSPSTGLLRTLPLSRYLAVMSHYATRHSSLLICTDFPTRTFHSILSPLWLLFIVMPTRHSVLTLLTWSLLPCILSFLRFHMYISGYLHVLLRYLWRVLSTVY